MARKGFEEYIHCPFHLAMNLLEGRWKFAILYVLSKEGTLRFKALERAIPGISTRMLTKELRHLEHNGIVRRVPYATVPPKVEYSLTDIGKSTAPVIDAISQWGNRYLQATLARESETAQAKSSSRQPVNTTSGTTASSRGAHISGSGVETGDPS